ncbi:hemerythrin domain-containing protein [Thiobacillus sp.]|uniref:hemerythrin domain-containing protein n=1 Tax=Thiobacillus sp. TaxID=924 RepID=UPI0017BFF38C|nr:hemerythrin domain-containing protein [Thiobacillus sp.]MBC2730607.1 hemerythrin domain-containing protein [Thiobacillus sp.]MBC2739344.1 hemerythrin domain-containing protein [Thiobacillus sp.]MBC2760371.1 hemerythrin domain-containing protein [Thiobacillus sp.]
MNTILDFLGSDHRACDDLFASAESAIAQKNWDGARTLFNQFQAAMSHHLTMEETVLFPAFEARTGNTVGPTQVMRMEHEQMRGLMQDMAGAVAAGDRNAYLGLSETLNMLMQQHNLKEENMLYPMSDQVLSGNRDDLIRSMQAVV